jgi:hypothetical protein
MIDEVLYSGARVGPDWDDSPAGIPPRTKSHDGLRVGPEGTPYRPGSAEPYSQGHYQQNQMTASRMHTPHAWVGTYFDRELSPYVRGSFEQAQGSLLAHQAAQSRCNWVTDQLEQSATRRGGGSGGWTDNKMYQSHADSRVHTRVKAPAPNHQPLQQQQEQQQGWEARAAYNQQADEMQAVYTQQLNEMLRYANQCSVMIGSKYRYKAARRRPASAVAGKYRVAPALEGCVERHVVAVRPCPP